MDSVSVLSENKSTDPGLGTNLKPFGRIDLSGWDRVKSEGIVPTKLVPPAELGETSTIQYANELDDVLS
jgi:hypothetical protein